MKRKLDQNEVKMSQKSLKNLNIQSELLKGDVKQMNFQLDFSLDHSANKLRMQVESNLKRAETELKKVTEIIKITQDQVDNGVESTKKEEK